MIDIRDLSVAQRDVLELLLDPDVPHICASSEHEATVDTCLELEELGLVERRSVTVHYNDGGSVNYIGFFLVRPYQIRKLLG